MKVRIYCPVGATTGFARAATDLCLALIRQGIDLEIRSLIKPEEMVFTEAELPIAERVKVEDAYGAEPARTLSNHPDVVIIHTVPMSCVGVLEKLSRARELPSKPVCIAYTTWEARTAPPEMIAGLAKFDQVWVPSMANLLAFQVVAGTDGRSFSTSSIRELRILPHCVHAGTHEDIYVKSERPTKHDGRPYMFYFIGAWSPRKDPEAVLRAYGHAFTKDDNVALRFHSRLVTKEGLVEAIAALGLPDSVRPAIQPSNRELTQEEVWRIHLSGDCFVSASHGEAWNLPAFDAMLFGNHVIVPDGQGTDDYLEETSASLYRCDSAPARDWTLTRSIDSATGKVEARTFGSEANSCKVIWLEPSIMELAHQMRMAYENKTRTIRVDYDPLQRYGLGPVGARAVQYIEEALTSRSTR